MRALATAPGVEAVLAWQRPAFDLDATDAFSGILERDAPSVVVNAAAWTDVDGCAREPELAMNRNGLAVGRLATGCALRGIHLIHVSTNEVFDGSRTDGLGYGPLDVPAPRNPYGASKLAGEQAAAEAFAGSSAHLAIVRTAWLFGAPGGDFPEKILVAARRAQEQGATLRLVADEFGNPTLTDHLAGAIAALIRDGVPMGIHHVTNVGVASRAVWAREVLRHAGLAHVPTEDVPASTWPRASVPPLRAALAATILPGSAILPTWEAATAAYVPWLVRERVAHQQAVP